MWDVIQKEKLFSRLGLIVGIVCSSACSKLEFATSEKILEKSDLISESFTAKGDYSDKSVDVLFVVDNSFSMELEQQKLGSRLDRFVDSLRGVDWQIGITTTDVSSGNYGIQGSLLDLDGAPGKILKPSTPSYPKVFLDTITREETINCAQREDCPSSDEEALTAILLAVEKRNAENSGLFREGADLAVIILTDEDELSYGPEWATKPSEVVSYLSTALPGKTATVFGLITPTDDDLCAAANGLDLGVYSRHAEQLALLTGGVIGSICDDDYSKSLKKIGERVVSLMNHVTLRLPPDPETLDVQLRPALDISYSVDGKRLLFSKPLPEDTQILVAYRQVGWDKYLTDEQREQEAKEPDSSPQETDDDNASNRETTPRAHGNSRPSQGQDDDDDEGRRS